MKLLRGSIVLICLLVVGGPRWSPATEPNLVGGVGISFSAGRIPIEPDYWKDFSVVLARVRAVRPTGRRSVAATIQPLGTLSGSFDAGEVADLEAAVGPGMRLAIVPPRVGDTILVILARYSPHYDFKIYRDGASYMPEPRSPIAVVTGVTDPLIERTLSQIRQLRTEPPVNPAHDAKYWRDHSVVVGTVKIYDPADRPVSGPRIEIFPTAVLTGEFDPGTEDVISVDWNLAMRREIDPRRPRGNDTVLFVLRRDAHTQAWDAPDDRSA